jgi:hypothetical protein
VKVGFHVVLEVNTQSGRPADPDKVDRAGGSLLRYCPAFSVWDTEPRLIATVYVEEDEVPRAVEVAMERVWLAFTFASEPLVLRSVTAYTEDEFDRVVAGG